MSKPADVIRDEFTTEEESLGTFVLPPALDEEEIVEDDTRTDSEGYTSKVFNCCY